jgi:PAS domain S-box-containing protein
VGTTLEAEVLLSIALTVTSEQRVESVLQKTVQGLAAQPGVALARIWLLPSIHLPSSWRQLPDAPEGVEHLHLVASAGTPLNSPGEDWSSLQGHFARFPMHVGKVGQVAAERHPILIKDIARDHGWIVRPEWAQREGIRTFAGYPLVFRDNLLGVIAIFSRIPLEDQEFAWLGLFANHAAVAITNTRAFEDLKSAEETLRSNERNLILLSNVIPTLIHVLRTDGSVLYVNQAVLDYTGLTLEDVQKEDYRARYFHPEDVERLREERREALTRPVPFENEQRVLGRDGRYRWFLVRYNPLVDEQGRIDRWYAAAFDIEDRKRTEWLRAAEMQTLRMITDGASLPDILNHVCTSIDRQIAPWFTAILLMDQDGKRLWPSAGPKVPQDWARAITPLPVAVDTGLCGTAACVKTRVVVTDIATESGWREEYRGRALKNAIRAGWSQPIVTNDNQVLGTFAVYSPESRVPTGEDLALIEAAARIVLIAIERQRSQEALRNVLGQIQKSESKLRQVIDAIPALAWCNLPDGPNEFLNKGWHEYTGLSPEESHGWGWQAAFHPEDLPPLMERWGAMLASGEPGEIEARLRRHDGVYRWFLIRAKPFRDESGTIVRWYGTSTDIDDRKRAEAEVEQAYLRLAEAQRLSKTGSFISDLRGDHHDWSHEAFRIFEFNPATKVTLQRIRDAVHPEDLLSFDAVIAHGMAGADVDFVFRIVTSRGAVKHVRGIARVTEQITGRPLFIGALQDVTESKVAEEALNTARAELAHMARITTLSALTASIAHEVNQPLAAIATDADASLNWLAAEHPDLDTVRNTLAAIVNDAHRAADVIQRVRQLATKSAFRKDRLDVNGVVRDVLPLVRAELRRHEMALTLNLVPELPLVLGDRVQLQQVLLNLVMNGIEAMAPVADRPRELVIRSRPHGDEVEVTVADTGIGIGQHDTDRLCTAFFTTKPEGMGMGLSICRSIVDAHGGRLWATPNAGYGATFHFALPAIR